ncbi:MAG: pre-peptidase C-terminal domain-containing protein [Acidobacteria bacterium]|nr:pre-peptidase C-terminal domain-containing protein [Acidobacteriota bacterium]
MLLTRIGTFLTLAALASCGGGLFRLQPNLPEPQRVEAERLTLAHGDADGWTVAVPQRASSTWRLRVTGHQALVFMAEGFEPAEFLLDRGTFYSRVPETLTTQLYADAYTQGKLSRRSRETGQACAGCFAHIRDLPPGESRQLRLRRLSGEGRDIVVTLRVGEDFDRNRGVIRKTLYYSWAWNEDDLSSPRLEEDGQRVYLNGSAMSDSDLADRNGGQASGSETESEYRRTIAILRLFGALSEDPTPAQLDALIADDFGLAWLRRVAARRDATARRAREAAIASAGEGCSIEALGTLTEAAPLARTGSLDPDCVSPNLAGELARYYSFTVPENAEVQIDLTSSTFDAWLALREGSDVSGRRLERDDDGGPGTDARIRRDLSPGTYTIEATSFREDETGAFTLTVQHTEPTQPETTHAPVAENTRPEPSLVRRAASGLAAPSAPARATAGTAAPSGPAPTPDRILADAVAAEMAGDAGTALDLYRQVLDLDPGNPTAEGGRQRLQAPVAERGVQEANAAFAMGRYAEARRLYRSVLDLVPSAEADAGLQRIAAIDALTCPRLSRCGTLVVRVTPPAEVSIDDRTLGVVATLELRLAPDEYRLRLENDDWRFPRTVRVVAGERAELDVDLAEDGFPR